ncbi:MAG TPA: zinc-dependent metalloprotease [Acidimicrobiales bacterium]|nr:zinc-dependent metalloprotease [Acidimicrobiales bacterium]
MTNEDPTGDNDPFGGLPFFGDLSKLFGSSGPVNWDAARQIAVGLATGGESESNVDPADRVRMSDLSRVAELHVATVTGLDTGVGGRSPTVVPVTRTEWATRTLADYRDLFEHLATGLSTPDGPAPGPEFPDQAAQMLSGLMQMMAPMMMAMSTGSMVGHLAERALGSYDLPIPRPPRSEIVVVSHNVHAFADEWSISFDETALWICIRELIFNTVFGIPHVRDALQTRLNQYVAGFSNDPNALQAKLGDLERISDPGDLQGQIQQIFGDPEVLLGAIRSPAQERMLPELEALVAVLVGYVDHIQDRIGGGLVGSYGRLTEAMRRRRITAGPHDRFVERILGLDLRPALIERGRAFIEGVVERDEEGGLARLWSEPRNLPTPAEVDAPGLWLARIDLPDVD